MKQDNPNSEDRFKEKLFDYESSPLSGSWDKISSRLSAMEERKSSTQWRFPAAAALVVLALSGTFLLWKYNTKQGLAPVHVVAGKKDSLKPVSETVNVPEENKTEPLVSTTSKAAVASRIKVVSKSVKKEVRLPDGSIVVLNRDSYIEYDSDFTEERTVRLSGEAYFDVRHNPDKPFSVFGNLSVSKVLGTTFIIHSVKDENYDEIYVSTGKVAFRNRLENRKELYILAGNKGIIRLHEAGIVGKIMDVNYDAWRTDKMVFDNTRLKEVFATLEKCFAVAVTTDNPEIMNCRFTGSFEGSQINEILQVLSVSFDLSYNEASNRYIISGKGCQ